MRMSELADRCLSSRSRLSHAVSRLEERGWVRRQVCESDGRGQLAVLTDDGFAALEAAAPVHVTGVRTHLFDQLSPQQVENMRDIGETLLRHLDPAVGLSAPKARVRLPPKVPRGDFRRGVPQTGSTCRG